VEAASLGAKESEWIGLLLPHERHNWGQIGEKTLFIEQSVDALAGFWKSEKSSLTRTAPDNGAAQKKNFQGRDEENRNAEGIGKRDHTKDPTPLKQRTKKEEIAREKDHVKSATKGK